MSKLVICIHTDEPRVDLDVAKVYRVVPDHSAPAHGWIRVIDNSGEDYLYPAAWFAPVTVPRRVAETLFASTRS